jgi:hypothetical protein
LHRTYGAHHLHFITCSCYRRLPFLKRGLIVSPEQWRWSSYRFYLLDETGPVRANAGWGEISFRGR